MSSTTLYIRIQMQKDVGIKVYIRHEHKYPICNQEVDHTRSFLARGSFSE